MYIKVGVAAHDIKAGDEVWQDQWAKTLYPAHHVTLRQEQGNLIKQRHEINSRLDTIEKELHAR